MRSLCRRILGRRISGFALVALAAAGAATCGCEPSQLAQRRLTMRKENLRETAGLLAHNEQKRPALVKRDLDFVKSAEQHHARALHDNSAWFGQLWQRDVEKFKQNQPEYRDALKRIFRGKPEQLEETAIILFY